MSAVGILLNYVLIFMIKNRQYQYCAPVNYSNILLKTPTNNNELVNKPIPNPTLSTPPQQLHTQRWGNHHNRCQ